MERGSSFTRMGIITKETGAITKHAGTDCTFMKMGINMKENGKMMSSMDMVKNDGLMALAIKGHTTKVLNMASDFISGQMDRSIMDIGITM